MATQPTETYQPGTYSTDEPATYPLGKGSEPDPAYKEDPFAHVKEDQEGQEEEPIEPQSRKRKEVKP